MRWALLAALLLLAVAAGVAVSQRHSIAERWLLDEIRRTGIDEASLVVEAVGVGSLSLADVRLGAPPALEIARMHARYSPGSLRRGYLDELQMSGLRLRASYDDDGLSLGALDVLWRGNGKGEDGGAGVLPARRITIADARVDLETPGGPVSLPFEIGIDDRGDGSFEAAGDFELRHPMVEASGHANVAGALDDFEGTLQIQGSPLSVPELRLGGPLGLRGQLEVRDSTADYRLTLADTRGILALDAKGSADLASRTTRADLHLRPIAFEEEGLQPAALFPFLGDQVEAASGSVEAAGTASWDGARAAAEIDLALREVGFTAHGATVSGLNGRIEIAGPSPPVTKPGQLISIALIDVGLELTDGLIEFQLRPDGLIQLERAEWQWAGGAVRTAGLLDPMADSQQLVLEVVGVDLAKLLALVNLGGLEGSGRLGGRVPISRSGETLEIRGGELAGAPEGGRIRYRPSGGAEAMAEQRHGLEQLLGALEDFHYDSLRLSVAGDTRGAVDVAVHLGGFNPNFERGRRVELNLNVEARLADLLRAGLAAYRVPEVIQKRLEEFEVPEVQ